MDYAIALALAIVAMAVLCTVIHFTSLYWIKKEKKKAIKLSRQWCPSKFPLPDVYPPLGKVKHTRSIEIEVCSLTFKWESNGYSRTTTYQYEDLKSAKTNYMADFSNIEKDFYETYSDLLIYGDASTNSITVLSAEVAAIKKELKTLKESLGE